MTVWHVLVYVVATVLALRSLISLMDHHRQHHRGRLVAKARAELAPPRPPDRKPADHAAA
jgi:hypothetical protein